MKTSTISPEQFKYLVEVSTRWNDNDVYGHVNNIIYYSFFDTAVNRYLIEEAGLDVLSDSVIAYVVNSSCNYYASLRYPETVLVGVGVSKLGRSSVTYTLGIFSADRKELKAQGEFVHVFVERETEKSTPIPGDIKTALEKLVVL